MDYQTLTDIIGQGKTGLSPAPSLNNIIEGIQSQYQTLPSMPVQSGLYGANRYVTGSPQFGEIQKMPEYGVLNQILGPNFVPSEFNIDTYRNVDTKKLSDLIGTLGNGGAFDYGGGDGGPSSTNGNSVDGTGLTSTPNVSPATIGAMATIGGLVTGLPLGLVSTAVGKDTIANAINAQNHANDVANNTAFVAAQMGIANTPANAAAIAAAIDSLSSTPVGTTAATPGTTGTGGAAASAASAAAAAAAAAGHSDAAIGAASQAAANAAISGATPASQAQAASDAAASVDGGTTGPGSAAGVGVGSSTGINGMDAASDAASAGGGAGGTKIICTAMNHAYGFGSFRNAIWIAYADKHLTKAHEVGYHTLFLPLVDFGFKRGDAKPNLIVRKILEWGTRHRSMDIRAEMRGTKRDKTGQAIRFVFEPLCYFVGKLKGY